MRTLALTVIAALALAPAALAQDPPAKPKQVTSLVSSDTPPDRFQRTSVFKVLTLSPEGVSGLCNGRNTPPPGFQTMACTVIIDGVAVIIMPNPCMSDDEAYGHLLCHEQAHTLGWPATHGP